MLKRRGPSPYFLKAPVTMGSFTVPLEVPSRGPEGFRVQGFMLLEGWYLLAPSMLWLSY